MGHSADDIIDAAKRAAGRAFEAMQQKAQEQLFASERAGRLGSSSHIAAEQRVFADGYRDLCVEAAERVTGLATEGIAEYLPALENLLQQFKTPVFNAFLDYAAPGSEQGFVRNEATRAAHELAALLDELTEGILADFRLSFPADGGPIRVSDQHPKTVSVGQQRVGGYQATVLKVMIASPSDVGAERSIIRDVVHDWNAIHSEDRAIVLMPVGWESHSSPKMGERPQEVINKQILRGCDLLIAVFWTKFGTPTGKVGSGTAEEIEEHLQSGKPALIYFSSEPVHADSIDPSQYRALKDFESQKLKEGLIERYETKAEFKDKLTRQLAQTIIREFGRATELISVEAASDQATNPTDMEQQQASAAAKELLVEAAKDQNGVIMRVQFLNGSKVQTNHRDFVTSNDPRDVAQWRAAVDDLEELGLVQDRTGKGEVFFVTDAGYRTAGTWSQGR